VPKQAAASMKLVYYAYGSQDPAVRVPEQLKGTLSKYAIKLTLHETGGRLCLSCLRAYGLL